LPKQNQVKGIGAEGSMWQNADLADKNKILYVVAEMRRAIV